MPPRRSAASVKAKGTRSTADDIYGGMIAEATSGTDFDSTDERPQKRRKAGPSRRDVASVATTTQPPGEHLDVSTNEIGSEGSDDDLAFEDIDIARSVDEAESDDDMEDIRVNLDQKQDTSGSSSRRRVAPRLEKTRRIALHKMHYACLLTHCMYVNSWCNNSEVHKFLRAHLTTRMRKDLRPNREHTQFQQNRTFTLALEQAIDVFKEAYEVTGNRLKRAYWPSEGQQPHAEPGDPLTQQSFIDAARSMRGSQDMANQLFCAMLRSVSVKARIVCSLQVLPLANITATPTTPTKPPKQVVLAIAPDVPLDQPEPLTLREQIAARNRLSRPAFKPVDRVRAITKKKEVERLSYPVFWVEVLDAAYQKWMPIDLVTETIGKPSKLEPPGSYPLNQLVYAIAFSKDGSAKDVTRRYARSYNSKTRRLRLESVGEEDWLTKTMRVFQRRSATTADGIEETEMTAKLNRERQPNNIQDFKGHPVYALERHLRRNEVIHPLRQSGTVNAGTAAAPKMEPVYRRADVHICRSADQWFRLGRKIKVAEQAVKLVPARAAREDSDDEEEPSTALYMLSQTELYIPEPVVRGKVPRNQFGNLDVYVPSMIPKGGEHVRHPLAKSAADILGIDAVDAVTGFKFVGRKGTAIITGVVVTERYAEAVKEVIDGLLWQEVDERSQARSALALRLWKRFLQGLKIAERVQTYATEPLEHAEEELTSSTAWYADDDDSPLHTAGRYSLEELIQMAKQKKVKPAKVKKRRMSESDASDEAGVEATDDQQSLPDAGGFIGEDMPDDEQAGGFIDEDMADDEQAGGFVVDEDMSAGFMHDDTDDLGGGFVAEPDGEQPGGFVADEDAGKHAVPAAAHAVDLTADTPPAVLSTSSSDQADRKHGLTSARSHQRPMTGLGKPLASDDDAHSLLSHDPDDEEAEPDWMDSD